MLGERFGLCHYRRVGTRWLVASVTAGHRHLVTLRPKGQRTRSQGYRVQTVCIVHDRLGVGLHDATTRLLRFSIVCNRPRSKSRRPLWYKGLDKQQQLTVTLQRATSTFFDTRSSDQVLSHRIRHVRHRTARSSVKELLLVSRILAVW